MYVGIKQCVHGYKIYKGPIYFRERKVTKGTKHVSIYVVVVSTSEFHEY